MATKTIPRCLRLRQLPRAPPRRSYHSHDHPPPPGPFTPVESTILSAATQHIPSHGFTHTSLALGAKDCGYLDVSTNLFPKGAFSLVHWHLYNQRMALAAHKEIVEKEGEGVGRKVKALTWERLMGNKDIIHRWQEALALMAQPTNVPTAISELSSLADEIWYLSGDTSVDMSWYTKRASLSAIYSATELFMTTDKSPQYIETQEFLDRRFTDVQVVGNAAGSIGQWVGFTAHAGLNVLRSKGVRI